MDKSLRTLLILSLATSMVCGKLAGYDYQPGEDLSLQQTFLSSSIPQYALEQQQSYAPVQETYKKNFYIFSAPEEDFEDIHAAHKIAKSVQKNVRVVFIRAPEQKALEHAALQLAKQAADDKTAIYVLSKQHDVGDLAQRLTAYREQYTQKPEVHFVKYRTKAEAEHAQQQIQSQYDLLRGTTRTSNEGAAPVLDFSSKPQASYGSAVSIVPAYNVGSGSLSSTSSNSLSNNAGLYNQQLLNSNVAALPAYGLGSGGSIGGRNLANTGNSASSVFNQQQFLSNTVNESPTTLALQSSEFEKAAANLAALNLLNSYKIQSQTQSSSSSSSTSNGLSLGSFGTIGDVAANYLSLGGLKGSNSNIDEGIAGFGVNGNYGTGVESLGLTANAIDNGAGIASALEAYGVSPRNVDGNQQQQLQQQQQPQQLTEIAVSKLNERQNSGAKLVFPTDGGLTNTYLPPNRRRLTLKKF